MLAGRILRIVNATSFSLGRSTRLGQPICYASGMTKNTFSSHNGRPAKRHKVDRTPIKEGSNEEVLLADIRNLLAAQSINALPTGKVDNAAGIPLFAEPGPLPERFTEVQVKISALSSTGDGLGVLSSSDHVYVVPFTAAGDTVTAKVITHFPKQSYSLTDFVRVVEPSPRRDDSRIKCPYFAKCSGCQFQMLSYEDQLAHKKTIIEKAYRNFSGLIPEYIPSVENTLGSPLQYGYRTKLTPHFDGPPGSRNRKDRRNGAERKGFEDVPSIGFMVKGTRRTLDIEDCPIGTEAVRMGMKRERQRVAEELGKYKRGATLLLRESTGRIPKTIDDEHGKSSHDRRKDAKRERHGPGTSNGLLGGEPPVVQATEHEASFRSNDYGDYIEEKTCITDSNATSTEYVDNFIFSNKAGAFFQNNNSILSKFTAYIRDHILPPSHDSKEKPIRYLIDAYSGSGLFTITLSSLFSSSTGIDIAEASITSARLNARANNIPERNATFIAADAAALFKEITYPPDETVVVIDPPRKGCDNAFLSQLLCFAPRRVVYVSCNVHTQARDVGVLITGNSDAEYRLESLRGFDFFPQTGHVEGVAVLNRHRGVRVTIGGVEGEGETG